MIQEYATARGMSVKQIFHLAFEQDGMKYGLLPPDELYEKWVNGWCVLPLYVLVYLKRTLHQEDIAEQPWLPFAG